jgi:glutathione S-transferase
MRKWIQVGKRAAALVVGMAFLAPAGMARADDLAPADILSQAYYDLAVAQYCGAADGPVMMGFFLLRHDLLARGNIRPAETFDLARRADLAADLEYFDRGLSGQRNWCATEGAVAVARFVSYFRYRHLP